MGSNGGTLSHSLTPYRLGHQPCYHQKDSTAPLFRRVHVGMEVTAHQQFESLRIAIESALLTRSRASCEPLRFSSPPTAFQELDSGAEGFRPHNFPLHLVILTQYAGLTESYLNAQNHTIRWRCRGTDKIASLPTVFQHSQTCCRHCLKVSGPATQL